MQASPQEMSRPGRSRAFHFPLKLNNSSCSQTPGEPSLCSPDAEGPRPASTCSLPAPGPAVGPLPAQVASTPALLARLPSAQETAALKGSINIKGVIPVISRTLPTQWIVFWIAGLLIYLHRSYLPKTDPLPQSFPTPGSLRFGGSFAENLEAGCEAAVLWGGQSGPLAGMEEEASLPHPQPGAECRWGLALPGTACWVPLPLSPLRHCTGAEEYPAGTKTGKGTGPFPRTSPRSSFPPSRSEKRKKRRRKALEFAHKRERCNWKGMAKQTGKSQGV